MCSSDLLVRDPSMGLGSCLVLGPVRRRRTWNHGRTRNQAPRTKDGARTGGGALVQHSINEPPVRRPIAKDPVDGTIGECHVPFVAAPGSAASTFPGLRLLHGDRSCPFHVGLLLTLSSRAMIRWPLTTIEALPVG